MHSSGLPAADNSAPLIRFGAFELDLRARQLRKHGVKIKLRGQPFLILLMLIKRSGEILTREEMREKLWPTGTFVDFEHSLNTAVKKLRHALGDSPEEPHYIETLPRVGYRFIGTVRQASAEETAAGPRPVTFLPSPARNQEAAKSEAVASFHPRFTSGPWKWFLVGAAAVGLLIMATVTRLHRRGRPPLEPTKIMIAVLPFQNLTGDPNQDYFSDGLTEEMITDLGGLEPQRLGVIARTSVMQYKHGDKSVNQIGRELGLQYVLEGSVRREGDHVRISAQLIRVEDQTHLWAQAYDRSPRDILGVEREVAEAVARSIELNLTPEQQLSVAKPAQVDPEVHDLYLKGRYFWNKRTEEGFRRATECFQAAIVRDSTYAEAYAGLADTYALVSAYSFSPPDQTIPKARAAAQRALQINEKLADAHTSLALISENYDWDWRTAEKEYQRAIQLDPNYALAHHWYAQYLGLQGRFDAALAEMQLARQLDPLSLIVATDNAAILYYSRQYDRAIGEYRAIVAMEPGFGHAHIAVAAYAQEGQFANALAEIDRWRHIQDGPWTWAFEAYVCGRAGQMARARYALAKFQETNKRWKTDPAGLLALAYTGVGDKDKAFVWLEKAFDEHSNDLLGLKVDPAYDPLRSDPRFPDLLRRVGLAGSGTGDGGDSKR